MPTVSIVIPVYGAEDYLPRCLDSIRAQTFADLECILVDDGSPDGSGAICDRYAAMDPRFRVIHKKNEGGSIARNDGVEAACGEWLMFMDNDDLLAPCAVETALRAQRENPDSVVLWQWCNRPEELIGHCPEELPVRHRPVSDAGQMYLESNLYYVWSRLFRMDVVKGNGIAHKPDMDYGDDLIFCVDYAKVWFAAHPGAGFAHLQLPLYCYEVDNANSMTKQYLSTYFRDELRLTDYLMTTFQNDLPTDDREVWRMILTHTLRTLGEGCGMELEKDPASPRALPRAALQEHLNSPVLARLLAAAQREKVYSPHMAGLRAKDPETCRRVWRLKRDHRRWYQRRFWLGYWLHSLRVGDKPPVLQ